MVKAELVKRSPLRILEKSIRGGLGNGNVAVIASTKGVGKTACLVHIATDQLFQGRHVIHVSFSDRTDHIVTWYEAIFKEISKDKDLPDAVQVHDEIIKNRVIMHFNQAGIKAEQLEKSLKALISDGHFKAEVIVVDGYDFSKADQEFLKGLKSFAAAQNLQVWLTADVDGSAIDAKGVPQVLVPSLPVVSVLITLKDQNGKITLDLVKDHEKFVDEDLHLILDPKTMLIDGQ